MPRLLSRLARIFAPLPPVPLLAQWQLLDNAFDALRTPPVAAYAPIAGGLAAFALFGQVWCIVWVFGALSAMLLCQRAAKAFDQRGAEPTPAHWARSFRACLWAQAIVLGAGGAGAAVSGNPAVALLIAFPLSFAAARGGATAALAGPARGQALLILSPLALGSLAVGSPIFLALAALAALQAGMAASLAEASATQAEAAAEAAAVHEPVAGAVALPKAAADFQKLLGRDQTTGLPNKHSFMHLLAQESTRAYRAETALSLLLIAWDDYDKTAAAENEAAVSRQIAAIASRLRATLHRQQDLLASLGGGRFAAVLPFTDAFGAKTVAENLQAALRTPLLDAAYQDNAVTVAISIGAATYCGKGLLPETQLLQFAEEALAAARKTGGDKITRYDPMVATLRPAPHAGATPTAQHAATDDLAAIGKQSQESASF